MSNAETETEAQYHARKAQEWRMLAERWQATDLKWSALGMAEYHDYRAEKAEKETATA